MSTLELGGVSIPSTLPDNVFYGFRLNNSTGHLNIEKIDGDTPIALPQENIINANDYKQWVWTTNTLSFSFSETGHLLMTVY